MIFFFTLPIFCLSQKKPTLIISLNSSNIISDSFYIECSYLNITDNVILLPIKYIKEYSVQSFHFKNKKIKFNGSDNQYVLDVMDYYEGNDRNASKDYSFNYCELDSTDYYRLKPDSTLKLIISLKALGYNNIQLNKAYMIQLRLHVNEEFKSICPQMWVGKAQSKYVRIFFK